LTGFFECIYFENLDWFFSPYLHSLQYQFANLKKMIGYNKTGKGYLKFQLINQREDFSLKLFFRRPLEGNIKKDAFIHIPHLLNFLFSSISLNF